MNVPSKLDVLRMVEEYVRAWEACIVTSEHPLAAVQTLHLAEGSSMGAKETRPSGRSRTPIRDMPGGCARTDRILKHVSDVSPRYRKVLEVYADTNSLAKTSTITKIQKRALVDVVREAVAVFQSGWLLVR